MRLFPLSSSSSASSDKEQSNGGNSRVMLYLNIYDLTPINNYLYWFGLGIFHSGIEGQHILKLLELKFQTGRNYEQEGWTTLSELDSDTIKLTYQKQTYGTYLTAAVKSSFRIHMIEDYLLDWIEASYMVGTDCLIADISYAGNQVITRQGYVKTTQVLQCHQISAYHISLYLITMVIFPDASCKTPLNLIVHGMEYGFGAHEYPTSGVFEVEPRSCPGFIFRRSVLLGSTNMSRSEFQSFMEHLSAKYHGDTYHLIAKNCNHFTDEVCKQLTGKPIPGWINRMARLDFGLGSEAWSRWFEDKWTGMEGSFCNCLLPESIQITAVRHLPDHPTFSDNDDDDDQESDASSTTAGSEGEGSNHHLLTTPNGEVAFLKEKPVRLAKELL
ncbi:hypothetical protein DKX38_004171 [Salix brachista]|uniref:PPPDE domain-containing protein n=1 Tax=Salix brachista TaxID=2182728 RepID=A0A5N5NAR7_9ROSI|nr:hypothetical protein DKX38_004171 [Salix brachista]